MDNRFTVINDLVVQAFEKLRKAGFSVDQSTVDFMIREYYSGNFSINQIKSDVESRTRELLVKQVNKEILDEGLKVARNLQNLSVQHKGITINSQDIDLLMIACSSDYRELEQVFNRINNITLPEILPDEDFVEYRQRVFDSYLDSLSFRTDYIRNNQLDLMRKVDYLSRSGVVSEEEMAVVNKIIKDNSMNGHGAIVDALTTEFGKERTHEMIRTIWKFVPIEKPGIKGTSVDTYRELDKQIRYFYDSITIDEEGKYGNLVLQDGTFEDERLRKALDFSRSMGKTMRINTLMFYMDCPEDIYNLDESLESRDKAYEKLSFYVDRVTKVLSEYPDVVRSVDVFNELLNRFPLGGDIPYMLRGDIVQDVNTTDFDNIKSGWLKHLTVEDICEVMQIARRNLPNVDFMYNDDHLTDPKKLSATIELIKRIQDYSKGLGIQLIDSIGTQMHIDNDVSKEDIRNMFIELSKFGLPIEVTEFDLAMTCGVDGLSSEQIEILRQNKINEIYEVICELKDECNIRGFTIWSKTDSQNFRVDLANEIAYKNGKEFISTLHGGYFTEGMIPKSAEMAKKIRKQNFNYHGHTKRCGHASMCDDALYVMAAKNQGINRIGFSDHVPISELEHWQQGMRMHASEVDEYIESVRKIQRDNPDMVIRCGFEAEYDSMKKGYLAQLRDSCDYMILGQHYIQQGNKIVPTKDNPEYPLIYAKTVCEAMKTGIYDFFAHPDYFMLARDNCTNDESKKKFMENAKKASYMICREAKELGIPLELNVRGADAYGVLDDGEFAYPHSLFWDIVAEVGNEVIYSVDAHFPNHLMDIDEEREIVASKIDTSKLNFVSDDYDPVLARESNKMLQETFYETLSSAVTYETAMLQWLVEGVEVSDSKDVFDSINDKFISQRSKINANASSRIDKTNEKITKVDANNKYSDEKKEVLKNKYELRKSRIFETWQAQEEEIIGFQEILNNAREIGCTTKDEYVYVMGLLSEEKKSNDPMQLDMVTTKINEFKERKNYEHNDINSSVGADKPKQFVYTANASGDGSESGGFSTSMNLVVVIGMLLLFGMILYFVII